MAGDYRLMALPICTYKLQATYYTHQNIENSLFLNYGYMFKILPTVSENLHNFCLRRNTTGNPEIEILGLSEFVKVNLLLVFYRFIEYFGRF